MLKKTYLYSSFEGQFAINKSKAEFQSVVLLAINLYLGDNFLTFF